MQVLSFTAARANLKRVMDSAIRDREEVHITRPRGEAVVVIAQEEWAAIQETLHLLGNPANAERLRDAIAELDADAQVLFERLRTWRADVAREVSKPAFTILHDATLLAIAQAQPRILKQLALLRGIGATKLDRYGGDILAIVSGQ